MNRILKQLIAICIVTIFLVTDSFAKENLMHSTQLPGPAWSPYIVGAFIGILSWATFFAPHCFLDFGAIKYFAIEWVTTDSYNTIYRNPLLFPSKAMRKIRRMVLFPLKFRVK